MIDDGLVELPGLEGRCDSARAVESARRLAVGRDGRARLFRVATDEPVHDDGTATRWVVRFDLPSRMAQMEVVVSFDRNEDSGSYGAGLASWVERRFPAAGSPLEHMSVAGEISPRRLRGMWRHQLRERRYLDPLVPDSAVAVVGVRRLLQDAAIRSMEARVLRSGIAVWTVATSAGRVDVPCGAGPVPQR